MSNEAIHQTTSAISNHPAIITGVTTTAAGWAVWAEMITGVLGFLTALIGFTLASLGLYKEYKLQRAKSCEKNPLDKEG